MSDESVRNEFAVFREDVVRCPGRDGGASLLGVVESVGGHSDSEDEETGEEPLEKGKARVSWYKKQVVSQALIHHPLPGSVVLDPQPSSLNPQPSSSTTMLWRSFRNATCPQLSTFIPSALDPQPSTLPQHNPAVEDVRELEVVDRAMLHHDIVAKSSDPLGQSGFVTTVDVLCDLRFCSSGREVKGVNSKELVPLQPLKPGGFAVYGGWLGKVEEALDHVIVRFADGSVCRVSNADPETLVPLGEDVGNEESPYHPGIRVRATSRSLVHARCPSHTRQPASLPSHASP